MMNCEEKERGGKLSVIISSSFLVKESSMIFKVDGLRNRVRRSHFRGVTWWMGEGCERRIWLIFYTLLKVSKLLFFTIYLVLLLVKE